MIDTLNGTEKFKWSCELMVDICAVIEINLWTRRLSDFPLSVMLPMIICLKWFVSLLSLHFIDRSVV